jgi:hypothetical protein
MLILPAPAVLNGTALASEVETELKLPAGKVSIVQRDSEIEISGVEAADEAAVREVAAAHDPATPIAPDDDLAARIHAVHDDPDVPAAVKKLTAALLGLNGEAAVAGRPTDR